METITDINTLPELTTDTIHIWGVHVPDLIDRIDALESVLSETERTRAARYRRIPDQQTSITARGALRILLSAYSGIPAANVEFSYNENGKPAFNADLAFNLSHSGDWIVLAFGRDRELGVDIEKINIDRNLLGVAERYFAPDELALIHSADEPRRVFYQLWSRKEAYLKANGTGVFHGLNHFSVPIQNGALPDIAEKDGWHYHALNAGSKYASAVVTNRSVATIPCYDFGGLKWDN